MQAQAILFDIMTEVEANATFICTGFFCDRHGRAATAQAFKMADLASHGYRKGKGVWIKA